MRKALCCWFGGHSQRPSSDTATVSAAKSTLVTFNAPNQGAIEPEHDELSAVDPSVPVVGPSEYTDAKSSNGNCSSSSDKKRNFALVFSFFSGASSSSSDCVSRVASRLFRRWGFLTHNFFNPKGLDEMLSEIQAVCSIDHSQTNSLAILLLLQKNLSDNSAGELIYNDPGGGSSDSVVKQIAANPAALLQPLIQSSGLSQKPKLLLIFQHDSNNVGGNISPTLLPMDAISSIVCTLKEFLVFYAYMPETRSKLCGCSQMLAELESQSDSCAKQVNHLACLIRAARNVSLQRRQDRDTAATMLISFLSSLTHDLIFDN